MADKPIIFSAPMIRALLDGRKTQTRRLVKLAGRTPDFIGPRGCEADPTCWGWGMPDGYFVTVEGDDTDHAPGWRNGWRDWRGAYAPGDRLWVREAHSLVPSSAYRMSTGVAQVVDPFDRDIACVYREGWERCAPRWRPSIHMPRWASRLTLTVTDVRVQRLQDISEADARAEGVDAVTMDDVPRQASMSRRGDFAALWDNINGPGAWAANPWVCALTFTVHRCNIDQMPGAANA